MFDPSAMHALLLLAVSASPFDAYLSTDGQAADGFDPPLADAGGKDVTSLEQPVVAVARGKVVRAATHAAPMGGVVVLEHTFFENHEKRTVRSEYAGLSRIDVSAGAAVDRRQPIGAARDLRFEIVDREEDPSAFVAARRRLFVPSEEPVLVLVDHEARAVEIREKGEVTFSAEIGLGQRPGRKRRQGDLKTPKGMYFVTEKTRGPFEGPYGGYYGGHWIKINYPNAFDAAYGLETHLVDAARADAIAERWAARELTPQGTPLGGGIGFHGWIGDWSWDDTGYLSWGCVVFHNDDIAKAFDRIPIGAMVILR
jgi:hypothetical protein